MNVIKEKLLDAGVANLKEFGYPGVTRENITQDNIYSKFFLSMLKENKGLAGKMVDAVIDELIGEIH